MRYPLTLFFAVVTVIIVPFTLVVYWLPIIFATLAAGFFVMETFRPRF